MAAKSYSNFKPDDIAALGISMQNTKFLGKFKHIEPSNLLKSVLLDSEEVPLSTEKAKSEFIIAPILNEVRRNNRERATFFSGYTLNVDSKRGLTGRCDFLFSLSARAIRIEAPLFCIIEAKNDTPDDENNLAQCIAEMYAAQLFNEKRNNTQIKSIYGAVTNGYEWIFLKLENNTAYINAGNRFSVNQLPELLGVLQHIIDQY